MEMTWDDYLAEVDAWKESAEKRRQNLSPAERAAHAQEAKAWLEAKLGRPLRPAAPPEARPKPSS